MKENIIYIIIPQERVHQGVIQPVAARQERRLMVIVRHPAVVRHPGAVRLAAVHPGAAHPITEITTSSKSFDADDYDVDGYYEDNKSDYDNYDDAYDAFEDDEDSWDDY